MGTVLGIYLAFSVIFLTITLGSLIGYGITHDDSGRTAFGIIGGIITIALFALSVEEYHEPKAIEVYQGKTTLEYTVKDGVKVDSVVVYRNINK